jgi:large repetitive protein
MMKLIKLLMLFCIGAFFIASTAQGQINPTIAVLPANSGVVTVGATLDLQITVGNTGTANVVASKLRPVITVPSSVTLLADVSQTGLPSGWIIVAGSNTGSQIRICNNTDVIAGGTSRNIIIKVQGVTVSPAQTFSGQLTFGGATCSVTGAQPSGNIGADDLSTSTITVQAAAACAITASATAGTIACNGGTTTLTATAAGAVGTVEYNLNGGAYQLSNIFTVNAAGSPYTVIAREVATPLCSATAATVTVSEPAVVSGAITTTNTSSASSTNGTATVVAAGGTGAYSYSWSTTPAQTTATATGLAVGTYIVTITTANGCTGTATATVSAAACNIAVSASAGAIACNGGTTTLTATATGASGAVEYSLNGGAYQSGNTFTVNAAGSPYTVTAREVANTSCSANAAAVTVSQPAALVASSSNTPILCNGGNSTVTVSATGGTAPYTGTGTFILTTGAYSYTVTDANNCTSTTTGTIAQPNAIAVTATFAPITTFGGTTIVTVSATGGTTPYVVSSIGTFVRADGSFTFTVTDANGCTGSTTIVIAPFSTPVSADPAVGQMSFATIANAVQSANSLLFTQDYKLRIPFFNSNQDEIVPNGTISLKINLGSKLSLATGFNLATAPLSNYFTFTSAIVSDSVIITGVQIAAIPADFTSELVFNVKGRLSCTAKVSTKINVVNLTALLIDEDLQNNTSAIQYTLPVTVSTTQVNVTCNGAGNGIINVNASPGTTVVIKNSSNATVTNTGLVPGVYTITATAVGDAPLSNTCSNTATVTIVQPALLVASSSTTANNTCNSGADGKITATSTGGTAPYSYTIFGPTVNVSGATSGVFSFLTAGTYTITSKDANNCTATTTATVTQPLGTAPNLSLGSDFTNNFFATPGVSQTIVYNVAEIAGNPAVGDTIRITRVAGFNINLNTTIASATVNATTYTLDNARWKIDNSDPSFVSIILTNPLNATAPGTILCNQRVYVAVSLTRNTTDVSNFPLTARIRKANGELILSNNLNTIIMTAE